MRKAQNRQVNRIGISFVLAISKVLYEWICVDRGDRGNYVHARHIELNFPAFTHSFGLEKEPTINVLWGHYAVYLVAIQYSHLPQDGVRSRPGKTI